MVNYILAKYIDKGDHLLIENSPHKVSQITDEGKNIRVKLSNREIVFNKNTEIQIWINTRGK